jgi:methylated-DNA-[protein]-cysteine S-methyltransferase
MTTAVFTLPMDTPVGRLVIECDRHALIGIRLPNEPGNSGRTGHDAPPVLRDAAAQLSEYFACERTVFDVPMRLDGTAFQAAVWAELSRIPWGATITYGELARRVGHPTGARAVGRANGKNPIPIIVPCHRVVAGNGIGGYSGGLPLKRALLAIEAIPRAS